MTVTVCCAAASVTETVVKTVDGAKVPVAAVTPAHAQALEYRATPEQALA